ncbi:MAG: ABC transporter permease [Gemmatimonadota bacterium]
MAVALLLATLPRGFTRDTILGDLAQEYRRRLVRSRLGATAWYWRAALQLSAAYTWDRIRGAPSALSQDLRFAVRSFLRSPAFTLFAALTLAVGIGATTSVFTIVDGLLFRPLHLPEPDRLVRVHVTEPAHDDWSIVVSGATYLDWRAQARSFRGLAGYRSLNFNLVGGQFPEQIRGASVTANFFDVLGVDAALGRTPSPTARETTEQTVVLSHSLWVTRFGSDPGVLGTTLHLNGTTHTVLGVMPEDLAFPERTALFVPSPYRVPVAPGAPVDRSDDRGAQYMSVLGRLAEGVAVEAAQAEMDALSQRLAELHPEHQAGEGAAVVPLKDDLVGDTRATLLVLLGAVGFVLVIACANVANLLTVRASGRYAEMSVRMALGAGLRRIRRQLLTESLVLAFLGGVPGFLLALWGTGALLGLAPEGIPRLGEISVDLRIFSFCALMTLGTALLFGLAPAVGLSDHRGALSVDSARGRTADRRRTRLRDLVVVTEVALSLVLLVGAGLLVRTLQTLASTDPGFDPTHTLAAHVTLPSATYEDDEAMRAFYDAALASIQALPGVESAATVLSLPMHSNARGTFGLSVEGRSDASADELLAGYQVVSPEYFLTMRIPVLRGRGLLDTDRTESELVAVINEALARRLWPAEDPLGRRLTFWGDPEDPDTEWATIVGVVGNTTPDGLDRPPVREVYLAQHQLPLNRTTFVARTSGDPYALVPALREAIGQRLGDYVLQGEDAVEGKGGIDLADMASIGLYGVLSYSVAQRSREIGIRKALGAPYRGVVTQVVRQGYTRVLIGLTLGLVGSVLLGRTMASQIYGVETTDPLSYLTATSVLAAVALLACWIPATRAAGVDPVDAIRDGTA